MASRDIYEQTFDEDVPHSDRDSCPECSGRVTTNVHETVCEDCGLVIADEQIDHGPEWREFDVEEPSRRLTGTPNTVTQHDRGIRTEITFQQVINRLDFSRFGAVVRVASDFELTPYRAAWFGLSDSCDVVFDSESVCNCDREIGMHSTEVSANPRTSPGWLDQPLSDTTTGSSLGGRVTVLFGLTLGPGPNRSHFSYQLEMG